MAHRSQQLVQCNLLYPSTVDKTEHVVVQIWVTILQATTLSMAMWMTWMIARLNASPQQNVRASNITKILGGVRSGYVLRVFWPQLLYQDSHASVMEDPLDLLCWKRCLGEHRAVGGTHSWVQRSCKEQLPSIVVRWTRTCEGGSSGAAFFLS
mmetsp:Transcript_96662/g.207423  ORF Transcript_96662/g.207423 Transcript_96662/m.207423 type:complete len:153 (-) Transcript_96662:24-482(-)